MRISDWSSDVCSSDLLLQAYARSDIAGVHLGDRLLLVGVHLHQTTDALGLAIPRVVDRVALLQHARIDANEGQRTDIFVGHDLERERSEEHTSELQSIMRISYAVFCLQKKKYSSRKRGKPETLNNSNRRDSI